MDTEQIQDAPHVGNMIKNRLEEMGMTKAEFGRRIRTSRQNINSMIRKPSMDTTTLFRVGRALNHDFFRDLAGSQALFESKLSAKSPEVLVASAEVQAALARLNLLLLKAGG